MVFLYFCINDPLVDALPSSHALSPPLRRKGWRIMASQGASPAPPSQGGMRDASLAPQGDSPAPPSQGGMGDASLAPPGNLPAPLSQGGMGNPSSLPPGDSLAPPLQGGIHRGGRGGDWGGGRRRRRPCCGQRRGVGGGCAPSSWERYPAGREDYDGRRLGCK